MRLCCESCGAGLVPAFTGLRCPRMNACGRGGLIEDAYTLAPSFIHHDAIDLGVPA